jgi:hypothetical protein
MGYETIHELEEWYENLKLDIYYMEEELEAIKDGEDYFRMQKLNKWIWETEYLIEEVKHELNHAYRG